MAEKVQLGWVGPEALARRIDQALLRPDATEAEIRAECGLSKKLGFYCLFVHPYWVRLAASLLSGSQTRPGTVIGFPLGCNGAGVKALEAERAVEDGAQELDMVANLGALKSKDYHRVEDEICQVVEKAQGRVVKVIVEIGWLTEDEIVKACELISSARAQFVKTSTGFGPRGVTLKDVSLLRRVVGDKLSIKASGGIRTLSQALRLIKAGADRIGTSAGPRIIEELQKRAADEGGSSPYPR